MIGIKPDWNLSREEIKAALLHRAIDSIQEQAGYVPDVTEDEIEIIDIAWIEYGVPSKPTGRWTRLEISENETVLLDQILGPHTTYIRHDDIPF